MFPFIRSIATVAAGITLGATLLQASSAQAASFFYDFNIQWDNNATTTGWVEVDDTPDYQDSVDGIFDGKVWMLTSLLDASFTHEGTTYGKSDLTFFRLGRTNTSATSWVLPFWGNVVNNLTLGLGDTSLVANDFGAGESQPLQTDGGYRYSQKDGRLNISATSLSVTERTATAVPEPATLAGLTLAGATIAATRRKQQRKIAA